MRLRLRRFAVRIVAFSKRLNNRSKTWKKKLRSMSRRIRSWRVASRCWRRSRGRTPNCRDRHKRGWISRTVRERTPGSCLRRPCGEPQGVGHFCPRYSSNVEGRKPWATASDVLPGDDGPSVQLSRRNFGDQLKGCGKRRRWSSLGPLCGSSCTFASGCSNPVVPSTLRSIRRPDSGLLCFQLQLIPNTRPTNAVPINNKEK